MWVWISIGVGLVVALIIFGVAALRAWRQVKGLKASLTAVKTELAVLRRPAAGGRAGRAPRLTPAQLSPSGRWRRRVPDVH